MESRVAASAAHALSCGDPMLFNRCEPLLSIAALGGNKVQSSDHAHTRSHKEPSEHAARQAPGQAPPGQAVKPTSRVDGKVPPIPLHRRIWP
jgi:hypothetical protein